MKLTLDALKSTAPMRLIRWIQVALVAWLVMMFVGAAAQSIQTRGKVAEAIGTYERIRAEAAESDPAADGRIRNLLSSNLFVAPAEQAQPPSSQAILGDAVLIEDQWYREGQTVNGFEIVSVGPNSVTLMRDGTEHRIVPFEMEVALPSTARGGAPGAPPERGMRGRGEGGRGEGGRRPGGAPDGVRGDMMPMRGRFEGMTPEQRQEMFERFRNATPEEREQMRERFRQEQE